ncbi:hypothetical protein [Endozoicomonas euniceicola]|uniref:Transposase n=1 Tax=Endozoicomonas euniceicola TaxID=1234143 RepID=A0ABY6GXF9_9GAMM|nr:hypothetical protein [Endozoicomonas euniceicola]UYM17064.1 hypothetical protein NX720_03810 [Endozoicomonas euniceicola]
MHLASTYVYNLKEEKKRQTACINNWRNIYELTRIYRHCASTSELSQGRFSKEA